MDLDRLRTFVLAAEELNFTQTARLIHLSQPAVSQQIRELEDSLGVALFERRGRGLALTPAGERLKPKARKILQEVERVREDMEEFRGMRQGVLRIGSGNTIGIYLLPNVLGTFSRRFPGVRPSLRVADLDALIRALQEGELDLALVEDELSAGRIYGWERVPITGDELVLIAYPDHPWAKLGEIDLEQLAGEPILMRQAESPARRKIQDSLAEAGFDPQRLAVRFELGHTEGLKRAVMAGLGVGFVSNHAIGQELTAGSLVEIKIRDFQIQRTFWLVRPADKQLPPHQERLCEFLLKGDWVGQPVESAS